MSSSNEDALTVFASILKPGSSLNPTFLTVLDGAFILLFLVFIVLAFLTSGNMHLFVLMGIELALWASVKWCVDIGYKYALFLQVYNRVVNELKSITKPEQQLQEDDGQEAKKDS